MPPSSAISTSLSAVLFAIPIVYILWHKRKKRSKEQQAAEDRASLRAQCDSKDPLRPPFPKTVKDLLQSCRLAYLSTVDSEASTSHLSLMRFTYLPSEEVIIMSTNRHTKKYDMLLQQRGVALLVHDFGGGDSSNGEYSITLNGTCSIVQDDIERKERYRSAHLAHNPDYPQFIVGDDIAILCVDVGTARICNIADQVIRWNVADGKS